MPMQSKNHLTRRTFLSFLLAVPALLKAATGKQAKRPASKERHYYIAAEEVMWDYAPTGRDLLDGVPIPAPYAGHTRWEKTRFIEYTDENFNVIKQQPLWLGILGPVIRAEVGDTIKVHF